MLPAVNAWGHDGPPAREWPTDSWVRCDHNSEYEEMGHPDDTWTGLAIVANYRQDPPTPHYYISGTWIYDRGYGGGGETPLYNVTSDYIICNYRHDAYSTTFYSYGMPVPGYGFYGNNSAYYQNPDPTVLGSFNPSLASSVSDYSASYFFDPANPSNQWYTSSPIYMPVV
ncbi:MAG: hypothetical protein NWF00_08615 [Candidatus Bathyarchaeota archaeon]|nr:hypothetical protein [Candidatus Bathyarchaeota archaeon]